VHTCLTFITFYRYRIWDTTHSRSDTYGSATHMSPPCDSLLVSIPLLRLRHDRIVCVLPDITWRYASRPHLSPRLRYVVREFFLYDFGEPSNIKWSSKTYRRCHPRLIMGVIQDLSWVSSKTYRGCHPRLIIGVIQDLS
jgi:hypothetical protein